jgi:hypothetical protein
MKWACSWYHATSREDALFDESLLVWEVIERPQQLPGTAVEEYLAAPWRLVGPVCRQSDACELMATILRSWMAGEQCWRIWKAECLDGNVKVRHASLC